MWIDTIICVELLDYSKKKELYELVKIFQKHHQFRTCSKYQNKKFSLIFGEFFTNRTIIAQPLPISLSIEKKAEVMQSRKKILSRVKNHIYTELNLSKKIFNDTSVDDYEKVKSIPDILPLLTFTQSQAMQISDSEYSQSHYKRMPIHLLSIIILKKDLLRGKQTWVSSPPSITAKLYHMYVLIYQKLNVHLPWYKLWYKHLKKN